MSKQRVRRKKHINIVVALAVFGTANSLSAQSDPSSVPPPDIDAVDFTVRQILGVRMPMRDGKMLVGDIYLPGKPGPHPVVLFRSPYQRNRDIRDPGDSLVKLAHAWASQGIGFIHQDTRGRGESEGTFRFFKDDGADGYDTIEWIAAQPWSNGQVAMLGGSYRATVQWLAAREQPPHLTCLFAQSPGGDFFNTVPYTGGAFQMNWSLNWINLTAGKLNQDVAISQTEWEKVYAHRPLITQDELVGRVLPMRRDFLNHPTFDNWWKPIFFSPDDYGKVKVPAFHVSGWFDGQLPGALTYWAGMRRTAFASQQHLLIGPWLHAETRSGGSRFLGDLDRGLNASMDIDDLALRWFKSCFAGTTDQFDFPRARVFMTGVNRWFDFPDYPVAETRKRLFYLHSNGDANAAVGGNGALSTEPPGSEPPDRYTFDPLNLPSGNGGGSGMNWETQTTRADALIYSTEPLSTELPVLGPVTLRLHAMSTARDTDFVASLYDVHPDGRALRVVSKTAVLRARYRRGFDQQVPLTPGVAERFQLKFFDVGHVFRPGHRIRIEVSSYAQGTNPNQNTGKEVATDTEWLRANQTIYHDSKRPSALELSVVNLP